MHPSHESCTHVSSIITFYKSCVYVKPGSHQVHVRPDLPVTISQRFKATLTIRSIARKNGKCITEKWLISYKDEVDACFFD